jgi:hypothetical protein
MTTERESAGLEGAGASACAAIMVGAGGPACICAAYFGTAMPAAIAKAAKVRTARMNVVQMFAVSHHGRANEALMQLLSASDLAGIGKLGAKTFPQNRTMCRSSKSWRD